jgi:hypothetical protein
LVNTGFAFTVLSTFKDTEVRTEQALNDVILQFFIVGSFLHDIKLQRKTDEFHLQTKLTTDGLYIINVLIET